MRRAFKFYFIVAFFIFLGNMATLENRIYAGDVKPGISLFERSDEWDSIISSNINSKGISIQVDGKDILLDNKAVIMDENMNLLIAYDVLTEVFMCSSDYFPEEKIVLQKFTDSTTLSLKNGNMQINDKDEAFEGSITFIEDRLYIPATVIDKGLSYDFVWNVEKNTAFFTNRKPDEKIIPYVYDYRKEDKMIVVKNQDKLGTCWAFAALTALETSMAPEMIMDFSEDHMSINNSFSMNQNDGGEYTISLAYLSAWEGPVLEIDDPYGDGYSPSDLEAVIHVQEAQILESKNYDDIKEAVFLYGGVQSSLYVEMKDAGSKSDYYDSDSYAYCYVGLEKPNHDIVIIGWDDTYPASKFKVPPKGDGAFICVNSWGREFGDNGIFYVSYYDSNIGVYNVVYTGIEGTDNYDKIYQTDLCGWVGQIGYNREYSYFANVFSIEENESLEAVSFYATGSDTNYKIYIVEGFEDERSFGKRRLLEEGYFSNAGYYTVDISEKTALKEGTDYAIVIYISTPNSKRPVAIEYVGDSMTQSVVLDDGRGYISLNGDAWSNTEELKDCNVCMKIFTNAY